MDQRVTPIRFLAHTVWHQGTHAAESRLPSAKPTTRRRCAFRPLAGWRRAAATGVPSDRPQLFTQGHEIHLRLLRFREHTAWLLLFTDVVLDRFGQHRDLGVEVFILGSAVLYLGNKVLGPACSTSATRFIVLCETPRFASNCTEALRSAAKPSYMPLLCTIESFASKCGTETPQASE